MIILVLQSHLQIQLKKHAIDMAGQLQAAEVIVQVQVPRTPDSIATVKSPDKSQILQNASIFIDYSPRSADLDGIFC